MFNTIYIKKKNRKAINANVPLILQLFFNGKDEFDGYWRDHEYFVTGL